MGVDGPCLELVERDGDVGVEARVVPQKFFCGRGVDYGARNLAQGGEHDELLGAVIGVLDYVDGIADFMRQVDDAPAVLRSGGNPDGIPSELVLRSDRWHACGAAELYQHLTVDGYWVGVYEVPPHVGGDGVVGNDYVESPGGESLVSTFGSAEWGVFHIQTVVAGYRLYDLIIVPGDGVPLGGERRRSDLDGHFDCVALGMWSLVGGCRAR